MNRISDGILAVCRPTAEILGQRPARPHVLRPDAKGRVCMGALADGVSGFSMSVDPDGTIRLVPLVEIPAKAVRL